MLLSMTLVTALTACVNQTDAAKDTEAPCPSKLAEQIGDELGNNQGAWGAVQTCSDDIYLSPASISGIELYSNGSWLEINPAPGKPLTIGKGDVARSDMFNICPGYWVVIAGREIDLQADTNLNCGTAAPVTITGSAEDTSL